MIAWINRNSSIAGSTEAQYVVGMDRAASTFEKELFAEAWLTLGDARRAAFKVFATDTGLAMYYGDTLPLDQETISIRDRLLKERGGKSAFLPDKEDVARIAIEIAKEKTAEDEFKHSVTGRLSAIRLYAELQGFIEPRGVKGDSNNTTVTKDEILEVIANAMPD